MDDTITLFYFLSGVINPPHCHGHKESGGQDIEQRSHNTSGADPVKFVYPDGRKYALSDSSLGLCFTYLRHRYNDLQLWGKRHEIALCRFVSVCQSTD